MSTEKLLSRHATCEYQKTRRWTYEWKESKPLESPRLKMSISLYQGSYSWLGLPPQCLLPGRSLDPITKFTVAHTCTQMDICNTRLADRLGINFSLFPAQAKVFGASSGAINIVGGILVKLTDPNEPFMLTVRMIYVARNVS